MNRYVIQGITEDLRNGRSVGVLTQPRQEGRIVFTEMVNTLDESEVDTVYRANGAERIHHVSGGTFYVLNSPAQVEGLRPDTLVVIGWELLPESTRELIRL